MSCTYQTRSDQTYDEYGNKVVVYGVDVFDTKSRLLLKSIPDIFLDKSKAQRFVSRCNKHNLSFVHLMDVIEDILP